MSFDWHNYLGFSETALAKVSDYPDSEAVHRSVVSRAYYAVYCATRNLVKQKDRQSFSGNAHQQLQDYLINHPNRARKRLGNRLKQLHQLRIKADYDGRLQQQSTSMAQQAIVKAKDIENDLAEIF